ncbi:MAG: (d)CMP kinase [Bryobacteraceae bacterium]|nr:(d)CMP kinase [Bryobacteraceae bacterium]
MAKRVVIAIDGPAGAGKSTVAKAVAERLGFIYINTGAMYRAVALWALQASVGEDDHLKLEQLALQADIQFEPGVDHVFLNGDDVTSALCTSEVSAMASKVSAVPGVRRALVDKQRELGASTSVVMEGRDIGTVVFPDSQIKIFLDAPAAVRANRRTTELLSRGSNTSHDQTARELAERDGRDRTRAEAPLVQAGDAVYIDSGEMTAGEVVEAILKLVRGRTSNGKEYAR